MNKVLRSLLYEHDAFNRRTLIDYPGSADDVALAYDANGNLISIQSGDTLWDYRYDALDQLLRETLTLSGATAGVSGTYQLDYLYDNQDHLDTIIYPTGHSFALNPDIFGRPTRIGSVVSGVSYYASDRPKQIDYPNGFSQTFVLDDHQYIRANTVANSSVTLLNRSYSFDANGNVRQLTDSVDPGNSFNASYDSLDRLMNVSASKNLLKASYQYDDNDNIVFSDRGGQGYTYTYDSATNHLQSISGTALSYSYDGYGNVSGDGSTTYPMSYQILDPILEQWVKKHGLHLYTTYKDEEVRSIDIVSPAGKRFQLWLDDPGNNKRIVIHVWDYRKRRSDFDTALSHLEMQLERAYSEIKSWF